MSVAFHECFVGGWFGFRRTCGAVARIETECSASLPDDWRASLEEVARWRKRREAKATSIDFYFVVPESIVPDVRTFVGEALLSPPTLRKELLGLSIGAVIFDADGGVHLDVSLASTK